MGEGEQREWKEMGERGLGVLKFLDNNNYKVGVIYYFKRSPRTYGSKKWTI